MDEAGIIRICDALHLDYGRVRSPAGSSGSRNLSIACPLAISKHGDPADRNKSCSVEVVDNGPSRVRCFSGNCAYKGSLLDLITAAVAARGNPQHLVDGILKEVQHIEAVTLKSRRIQTNHAVKQAVQFTPPPGRDRDVLPERFFAPFAGKIPKYAIERGIEVDTAKAWGLGYDTEGYFLVFPVRRSDQKLVGLVGRAVSDKAKRPHHNYHGLDKTKYLFGAHMLRSGRPIVIVESCIDALNTWQALREEDVCVVATLGEGFSDRHALTLSAMSPPFVYVFTDGDPAGRLMANKIVYGLRKHVPIKIMECPWGPIIEAGPNGRPVRQKIDPSNLPDDYILDLYRNAPIVRKKIRWTNPPPYYNPNAA